VPPDHDNEVRESTRVSLPAALLVGCIISLGSAFGVYFRLQFATDDNAARISRLEASESRRINGDQEVALHLQKLDLTFEAIKERLDSIDRKVTKPTANGGMR
jgi:hypothetical protein